MAFAEREISIVFSFLERGLILIDNKLAGFQCFIVVLLYYTRVQFMDMDCVSYKKAILYYEYVILSLIVLITQRKS